MNRYVSDSNIIFSGLISGKTDYIDLVTDNHLYLPDFALVELQEYQQVIWEKTRQKPDELKAFTLALFDKITVVPNLLISLPNYRIAYELCKDIDPKDMTYVALSIELVYPLLTRDKPLADGLRTNGFTNVITLDELFRQRNPTSTNDPQ